MPCCTDARTGLAAHNRLDLIQQTLEFTAPECGSPHRQTGKPQYCCYDCPTLVALHRAGEDAKPA
jgi:hypothetical protein